MSAALQDEQAQQLAQYMDGLGQAARAAAAELAYADPAHKNRALLAIATVLDQRREFILQENARDLEAARENDLATALREGLIAGAAFDVTVPPEPPAPDNPLMALLDLPNFILTPHVAWASQGAMQTLADQLIDNIEAFAAGNPVNVVSGAY